MDNPTCFVTSERDSDAEIKMMWAFGATEFGDSGRVSVVEL